MTALSLLGKSLKDEEIIDILEQFDVDVVYSFDRIHENTPDVYWAAIKSAGFQLRFNEQQTLDTIFCYIEPREGFASVTLEEIGVPMYDSFDLAEQSCQSSGAKYQTSGASKLWLKIDHSSHGAHYEFKGGRISMVTLTLPWDEA